MKLMNSRLSQQIIIKDKAVTYQSKFPQSSFKTQHRQYEMSQTSKSKGKVVGSIKDSSGKLGSRTSGGGKSGGQVAQSQQLALPKQQLEEFSQAADLTTTKFEKLLRTTDELLHKSAQNPGESARTQESVNQQIEEQGFNMVEAIFTRMGGQKAAEAFMTKRFPKMVDHSSMRERSDEGGSVVGSIRQSSNVGKSADGAGQPPQGLLVKSQVTNLQRSTVAENGMVKPFDQVMSNFAMYGLANRNSLAGPVDTGAASQVAMMQELSGLCLKIYRSVNLRFQRIAQMMLSGNTQELKELIETNFHHKLQSYQALVLTRVSAECLMVDEPAKKIGIIGERALLKQHELPLPAGNALRSTLQVRSYIFAGFSNGLLQRLDSETLEVGIEIKLHTHVFCIEQFDEDHIICGQMNGWVDLVRIDDGAIVLSKELRHVTGNITMIVRTGKGSEVMLGTQRGIYFAMIGKGLGLMEVEMQRFEKSNVARFGNYRILDEEQSMFRMPESTERADATSAGVRHSDLDGMSQMTFHTQSQFGARADQDDDAASGRQGSQTASVYTKPFTVQSNKGSEKSKMQQSMTSRPATEAPGKAKGLIKIKDRKASIQPEKVSDRKSSHQPLGTVAPTVEQSKKGSMSSIDRSAERSKSKEKRSSSNSKKQKPNANIQSQQIKPGGSILKNSQAVKSSLQIPPADGSGNALGSRGKKTDEAAESQDMVMQSQNSNQLSTSLKKVRHADQVADSKSAASGALMSKKKSRSRADSEDPTEHEMSMHVEDQMDMQQDSGANRGDPDEAEDEEMKFVLCAERYLIGLDIRGIVHLEPDRFGVVAWNDAKVYSIDRDKPDAVVQFNMPHGERHSISMRLIPFYDANQFPFAVVLCQTSICCIDFKRYNAFKICPWKYKGVPNNVNQLEMHLSKEEDQVGEQINIVTLEFDGSNSYVRRLVLDHDCIQALNFLGQD